MRRGITLLELLLALAMFIVLMSIVWSVVLILLRAEKQRVQQTEQQRIVRTWTQMMNNDFRSAIQDTEQLNKAEGNETIRHFGFNGTATRLRIDVLNYSWRSADASDLKTILYDFQQTSGLMRQELDYAALTLSAGVVQTASEVVGCQFRYFDGRTWYDYWASLDRKGAPSAVEVTLYSLPCTEAERWRRRMPNTGKPTLNRIVFQIPAASQTFSESYKRTIPPKPSEETATMEPATSPSLSPPQSQLPSPPSPFHSLFGND